MHLRTSPLNFATPNLDQFFYSGDQDSDEALDEADQCLIEELFGQTPLERWAKAEKVYRSAGIPAEFRLYPGVGHEISAEMQRDAIHFPNL